MGLKDRIDAEWKAKVAFMREVGATKAEWFQDQTLCTLELGPAPRPPAQEPTEAEKDEALKRVQAELDALAFLSS